MTLHVMKQRFTPRCDTLPFLSSIILKCCMGHSRVWQVLSGFARTHRRYRKGTRNKDRILLIWLAWWISLKER